MDDERTIHLYEREAREEDRAQIHGYRESALTSSESLLYRAFARLARSVRSTARSRADELNFRVSLLRPGLLLGNFNRVSSVQRAAGPRELNSLQKRRLGCAGA